MTESSPEFCDGKPGKDSRALIGRGIAKGCHGGSSCRDVILHGQVTRSDPQRRRWSPVTVLAVDQDLHFGGLFLASAEKLPTAQETHSSTCELGTFPPDQCQKPC